MGRKYIKGYDNMILGSTTEDSAGKRTVWSADNRNLGNYDPKSNITKNYNNTVASYGDSLSNLIDEDDEDGEF